jgi:hypothetical protein
MASISGKRLCNARKQIMSDDMTNSIVPLTIGPRQPSRRPPVRVKLRRINASLVQHHPPDGLRKDWWERLGRALGTKSSAFVQASLLQLQAAARLPCSGISEIAVNAALAYIEAVAPKDEVEAALAVQMAATHSAAMAILARFSGAQGTERNVAMRATAAARLLRVHAEQVEILRRLRRGPDQVIRIERVDVHDGGQAIVGGVATSSQ